MSRHRRLLIAAVFAVAGATSATAYDGGLVRIEPRPYYGAVVTVEQGVRVYRPLPTQNLMIINPNQTPVNISFSRTIEHKAADNSGNGGGTSSEGGGGSNYGGGFGGLNDGNRRMGNHNRPGALGGPRIIKRHAHKAAKH